MPEQTNKTQRFAVKSKRIVNSHEWLRFIVRSKSLTLELLLSFGVRGYAGVGRQLARSEEPRTQREFY